MICRMLVLILALGTGMARSAEPVPKETPVDVVSAEFGIFEDGAAGDLILEATRVVPHKVGQRYGWIIEVRTTKRSLAVREEYLLPTPPTKQDAMAENLNLPSERRRQVSQRQLVPVGGRIYGEWAVGPNEPPGRRHLQVVVEGQVAANFEYEVK